MTSQNRVNRATSLLILGAGGHAKVTADLIRSLPGHALAGLVDQRDELIGQQVEPGGGVVVMTQSNLFTHLQQHGKLPDDIDAAVVAIGHNAVRDELSRRLLEHGALAPALIHPAATISPSATIGLGGMVLPGVVVNAAATIGVGAILNTACIVEHDCVLADGVHVSPGAILCGNVHVGRRSWIGAGATIIPGVRIGDNVIVGANATVLRDVPSDTVVVGSPARQVAAT